MRTIVIGGTQSGAGKTTVATALMAALRRRGLRVQGYKCGPDFIDPTFHTAACGRPGRNLDGWLMEREGSRVALARGAAGAEIGVVEGVMGLFDGAEAAGPAGSTAEMARFLRAPVVLVVDARAMARSAAAVVRGFETFDPELQVAGVVFNQVAGEGHARMLREAVERYCRTRFLGALPRAEGIALPERHLGLKLAGEVLDEERLGRMADWMEAGCDVGALVALAAESGVTAAAARRGARRVRIGVARDAAFCFYYQANLEALEEEGAELVEFSPMADERLPESLDGLYLGGGYPELHAEALERNAGLREEIRERARGGLPVFGECGGMMYLGAGLKDVDGRRFQMAGVLEIESAMGRRLAALGYRAGETLEGGWLKAGLEVRGHEFHYSTLAEARGDPWLTVKGQAMGTAAFATVASYCHVYFDASAGFARAFVRACEERKNHA